MRMKRNGKACEKDTPKNPLLRIKRCMIGRICIVLAVVAAMIAGIAALTSPDNRKEEAWTASSGTYLTFRSEELLNDHYEKHGREMGFENAGEYEAAANQVIQNVEVLRKTEAEDGDYVYYLERTNEFVIVSTDGYLRTYFYPDDGIDYYMKQ